LDQTFLLGILLALFLILIIGLSSILFLLQKKKPAPPPTRQEAEQKILGIRKKLREEKEKTEKDKKNKPIDTNDLTAVIRIWLALDRIKEKLEKSDKKE